MNICIIGKYPPIQGGVSSSTYWLSHGLAERGHEIHMVTNADEVEEPYRILLGPNDWSWYQPDFGQSGGRVRVYNVEPFSRRTMSHIPEANPFVSKLASLATEVVRFMGCQLVCAYYYEPYAVAGWLASRWTGRPLVVKHAGSDLDRLFRSPALSTTYKNILKSSEAVVTRPALMPRFLGMGVHREQLQPDIPFSVPTRFFHPQVEPLDVGRSAIRRSGGAGTDSPPFDPVVPSVGIYGKTGTTKGTLDLITALGQLARESIAFNLVAMIGPIQGERLAAPLRDAGLNDRTYILPLLPNWKVPAFIRACTAVCFLERDFPVAIHGPIVPREVLACGTCLVLSAEIASKQPYRDEIVSGQNMMVVGDPKDHVELTAALRSVLTSPGRARVIGQNGYQISRAIEEGLQGYIIGWENMFASLIEKASRPPLSIRRHVDIVTELESIAPELLALLRRRCTSVVEDFFDRLVGERDPFEAGIRFCDFVAARLAGDVTGDESLKLLSVVKYQRARLLSSCERFGGNGLGFAIADQLQGRAVTQESVWHMWPVRSNSVRCEEFEYDVSPLFTQSVSSLNGPEGDFGPDLTAVPAERLLVLFHLSVNFIPCELRIDQSTRELVMRCDGKRTTCGLVEDMCNYFGAEKSDIRDEVARQVLGALDRLYRAGVIVFGHRKPGWGWTGGARPSSPEADWARSIDGAPPGPVEDDHAPSS